MRAKEFNRNRTLEKCISLFWENGYMASGIKAIVEKTGVNRYSLYDEFGSKHGILLAAIDLYWKRYAEVRLEMLKNTSSPREGIHQFLKSFFKPDPHHQKGCFIVTIALEVGNTEEKVADILDEYLHTLKLAFKDVLCEFGAPETELIQNQLIGLYCSSMSMGTVFENEIDHYIETSLNIILPKAKSYA